MVLFFQKKIKIPYKIFSKGVFLYLDYTLYFIMRIIDFTLSLLPGLYMYIVGYATRD